MNQPSSVHGETVYFEFDSSTLDASAKSELDDVAEWIKENPDRKVIIAGHTDDIGAANYNYALGQERARASADYLIAQGVPETRIEVVSAGEQVQIADSDARNRRTVFFTTRGDDTGMAGQRTAARPTQTDIDRTQVEADDIEYNTTYETTYEEEPTVAVIPPAPEPVETDDRPAHLVTPAGMAVSVGGGVTGFVDGDARDFANEGGSWEARVTYGTRSPLAIEAAYVGTAQSIDALGLDEDAVLLGSGVEGALRLNILQQGIVQPYVFGGAGWTRYDVVNDAFNTSSIEDEDDTFQIPLGAGVGFRAFGAMVDVRGTVRPAFSDNLMDAATAAGEDAGLDNWNLGAKVGWEF